MIFNLSTARPEYREVDCVKLRRLGFTFTKLSRAEMLRRGFHRSAEARHLIGADVEIEINSISDLVSFVETYGEIIVSLGNPPEIKIYDDRVE